MRNNTIFLTFFVFFALIILLSASSVSAAILLSEVNPTYNLGDAIALEIEVSRAESFQGFFRAALLCNNVENLMYFSSISLEKNKDKTIAINFPVAVALGNCNILASLEDVSKNKIEETKSSAITLSNKIDLAFALNKKEFAPSDTLQISGTAIKANGQESDGIALITLDGKEYSALVSKGKFAFTQKLEPDIRPGEHQMIINVKDNSNNLGNATISFKIASVPTTLAIETNNESFLPDSLLMITPKLFDQANNTLSATISIKLAREVSLLKTDTLLKESVGSGNSTLYRFTRFSAPGAYIIEASVEGFNARKEIILERYEKVSLNLENDTLTIENIGNVPFKRAIKLQLFIENQSYTEIIDLDLEIGESKQYRLEAPKGTYDISIDTGVETLTFSKIPLTGNVVATIDLEKEGKLDLRWLWIVLAFIAILIVILVAIRNRRHHIKIKREVLRKAPATSLAPLPATHASGAALPAQEKPQELQKLHVDSFPSADSAIKKTFLRYSAKLAANSIVPTIVYGTKQEVTALFIHLDLDKLREIKKKDSSLYDKILNEYFNEITNKIKEHQGVADLYGNNLLVLFNVVKQYRHDIAALKTAEAIRKITAELNTALASTGAGVSISMKAGINTGFVNINAIQNREVRYTSIGNTVAFAKTLQDRAIAGEILFTEKIYDRVANVIKAKKMLPYHLTEQLALNIYSLEDSSKNEFREKHDWYVKRALGKD